MAGFSGALKLAGLDDFITPSQVGLSIQCLLVGVHCLFLTTGVYKTSDGRKEK